MSTTAKDFQAALSGDLGEQGLYDAIVVNKSSEYDIEKKRYQWGDSRCLSAFKLRTKFVGDTIPPEFPGIIAEANTVAITRFHNETVRPLVLRYVHQIGQDLVSVNADAVEARFYKAFYHHQYFCNMVPRYYKNQDGHIDEENRERNKLMLAKFLQVCDAQEQKDLLDVHKWVGDQYDQLMKDTNGTPESAKDASVLPANQCLRDYLITQGLDVLQSFFISKNVKESASMDLLTAAYDQLQSVEASA